MFSELSISKHTDFKKHLNQYDVIHLDIQWCIGAAGSVEQVLSYITERILEELKQEYPHLLTDKLTSIPDALSLINAVTEKKFIIIIDEWDVLIRDEAKNQNFVFIPKPEHQQEYPALVVELKWNKNAKTALQQIKEKHYPNSISQYTGQILLVGINYDKKTKKHQCAIECFSKH